MVYGYCVTYKTLTLEEIHIWQKEYGTTMAWKNNNNFWSKCGTSCHPITKYVTHWDYMPECKLYDISKR